MKVIVYNDRDLNVIEEYSTQNENDFEVMEFKFSSLFDNYNKKIVFLTPDGNISYYINNNKFFIPREITQYEQVKFYIWCTFENKDFRTKLKILSFYKNENVNIDILPLEKAQIEEIINELEKNILIVQNLEKQTNNLIKEIKTKLNNGDFVGPQGPSGPPGPPGPQGEPGESYDDTEIKEEISDIKEEQTTQNTRIEELEEQVQELENNQLTGTATGQSIYIKDSTNTKVRSIGLSGNSEQNVTNNLLNLTTVGPIGTRYNEKEPTLTNGIINVKGKNDETINVKGRYQNGYIEIHTTSPWKPNTNYYISCKIQIVSNIKEMDTSYFSVALYGGAFGNITYNSTTGRYEGYITSPETISDTDTVKTLLEFRVDGMELNVSEISLKTTQDYTFNGYGISPSPEVPSEIHSTGDSGSVNEKVQNKNLWSADLPILFKVEGTDNIIPNDYGGIDIKLTTNQTLGYVFYDLGKISDYKNKTLTFSISNEASSRYKNCAFINCASDGSNRTDLKKMGSSNNILTYSVNDTYTKSNLAIRLYISDGTPNTTYSINHIQVEENPTASSYQAHEEQNISFPLAQGQKLMQGDYLADDGVHHVMKQVIVSGTTATFSDAKNNGLYFCDQKVTGNLEGQTITFDTAVTNSIVQYELAEEVIDPYTEEQQAVWEQIKALRTYKPVTHITSTDEVPATVDVTYVKDLETVINNLRG